MKTSKSWLPHLLLAGSGAVALVYELVWMRWCTLAFGATAPAVAATLAAVFLGLGAGGAVLGARAARWSRPLAAYGRLELGAALAAALVGPSLALAGGLHSVVAAIAVLFPTTFLMGGTLPALVEAVAPAGLGVSGGGLYAANLAGAVLGVIGGTFVAMPALGVTGTYAAAVALNAAIGAAALACAPAAGGEVGGEAIGEVAPRAHVPAPVLGMSFVSGFVQVGLQAVWTRMFAQVHESSVYAFAIVVGVQLVGLAAGAALARAALARGACARTGLAASWAVSGAWVASAPALFWWASGGLAYVGTSGDGASSAARILAQALPVLVPPTVLGGMALPFVMQLAGDETGARAAALGRVLAANSAGCTLGPLVFTFGALPSLGLWGTAHAAGAVFTAAAVAVAVTAPRARALAAGAAAIGLVALALARGHVPPRVRATDGQSVVCVHEGAYAVVAVLEDQRERFLKIDNYYTLGGTGSAGDERFQAHLPLVLHPKPKRALFLGLGSGVTAGAAILHDLERTVAVEIAPEVVAAARDHFAEANLGLIGHPASEVVADDARAYLARSPGGYDVIVGDLVVPWRPAEAALFSAEHFEICRKALAPGGIFCQWVPAFQVAEPEFDVIAATFLDVFPRAVLWRGDCYPDQPALALIGLPEGTRIDPAAVDARMRAVAPAIARTKTNPYLTDPAGPWIFLAGPISASEPRFARAPRHRDARPWLEFASPATHARSTGADSPLFVGAKLQPYVEEVARRPLAGTPLAGLEPHRLAWRSAGLALARSALAASQGREADSQRESKAAYDGLPDAIRSALEAAP